MIQELDQDNLHDIIKGNDKVFVQFSATWCGNCKIMKPKFKKLSGEREDATFVVVDAEKFPDSRKLAQVDNLPTFAAYRSGELVNQVQTNKFDILKALIDEVAAN